MSCLFSEQLPEAVYIRPETADVPPGAPEEPPAQAFFVIELLSPAQAGDHGPDLFRTDLLRGDLGIPQQLECPVREHPDYPVEHIFHPEPDKEDHISHLDGPGGQVQEYRIAGVEEGSHAGARHGDGDVCVALAEQGADGIEIALGIQNFRHGAAPFAR